jgi:hypothetical protein
MDALDVWGTEVVIQYANGSETVANNSSELVKQLGKAEPNSITKIEIYGHTDERGAQTLDSNDNKSPEKIRKINPGRDVIKPCDEQGEALIVGPSLNSLMYGEPFMPHALIYDKDTNAPRGYSLMKLIDGKYVKNLPVEVNGCSAGNCNASPDGVSIARAISQSVPGSTVKASTMPVMRWLGFRLTSFVPYSGVEFKDGRKKE